ncbi:MAG: CaiB/BaiF CoA transferase family protein [Saprospiraceae bacterium]
MELNHFFKDLKVIELASVLAGPAVGLFFSELGAEVRKVENVAAGGDVTRSWKLPVENPESDYSAYFCSVNWNKQHFFLDLMNESDQNLIHKWIKSSDVVITNFKESSSRKMRMDYQFLKTINPRLIFAQLFSYSETDSTPAYDIVLQAEAGFLSMTGEKDRPPVRMPVAFIDLIAAHQLKEGILLALLDRERTGSGALVSVSLYDAAIASLANQASNYLMTGFIPQPMGSQHPNIAPYGDVFTSKDNQRMVFAVGNDVQFSQLCDLLEAKELKNDPSYAINSKRVINRADLIDKLQNKISEFEMDTLINSCRNYNIPAGRVNDMQTVFQSSEAQKLVLEEKMVDGAISKRVKTVVFNLRH